MQGIDKGVDGVLFIGYHARNGSQDAILDHTWSSRIVSNVWLNDTLTGEYGLNAAVAGHFGVPVIMVSGDQTACAQATELLGNMETAVVKQATGRFAAECLSPQAAQELIATAPHVRLRAWWKGRYQIRSFWLCRSAWWSSSLHRIWRTAQHAFLLQNAMEGVFPLQRKIWYRPIAVFVPW